jgi:penicillin-binding protein 1A
MFTAEFITQEEFDIAGSEPVTAKYHGLSTEIEAPYVAEMVRSEMLKRYPDDLYTKGYRVTTSIDSRLQVAAQRSVRSGLHNYDRKHGLRHQFTPMPIFILSEQQHVEVMIASEAWTDGDPIQGQDKYIDLPPSPADLNLSAWLSQIKDKATPGNLLWAVVTGINTETQEVSLALKDRSIITMPIERYSWARNYIGVNELGPKITAADQLFSIGQQALVQKEKGGMKDKEADLDTYWLAQEPAAQASLVSFDPQTGGLKALVGGYDYSRSKFNRSIQADRQPGSSFKPFVYSAGLESGFTPASIINDAPVVFDDDSLEAIWRPENYSGQFFGPTRLRQALYKSRNLVSIRLLSRTGIGRTIRYISNIGIPKSKLNRDLSLALGSSGLTPFEMASAYNSLANGGHKVTPHFILTVEDNEGTRLFEHQSELICEPCLENINNHKKVLQEYALTNPNGPLLDGSNDISDATDESLPGNYSEKAPEDNIPLSLEAFTAQYPPLAPKVMDSRVNYLMYTMLKDVIKRGTGKRALALQRNDLAGKTGTTNDQKDAWFSGFNSNLVANVWVGFDNPKTLGKSAFGSNTALPIWVDYMGTALQGMADSPLKRPDGLVSVRIDPETGNRAYPGQGNAIFETFRIENVPKQMEEAPSTYNEYETDEDESEQDYSPEQLF